MFTVPLRGNLVSTIPCVLSALLSLSCGGSEGSEVNGGEGNGNGSGNGSGGGPALGGVGTGATNGTGSGNTMTISRNEACVTDSATADAIPAVIQLVVDTSGSMNWAPGRDSEPRRGEMSKWEITSAALKEAVAELPSTVALGLNFYPNTESDDPCIRNRVEVPIALLGDARSNQRNDVNQAIDNANPRGGTPTHAAYRFGAETVVASTLDGRKFVLLITDGVPTYTLTCGGDGENPVDSDPLIQEAAAVFAQDVSTFVIGSPGSEGARPDLSRMASEGGTAASGCSNDGPAFCHLDMTEAPDFGAALTAGLGQIAGQISACEYVIPKAPTGQTIDLDRVNVIYTKGDGSEQTIPRDPTATECNSGWQYSADQTQLTLCGAQCDAVKADPMAKIELIFGCFTDVGEPPK